MIVKRLVVKNGTYTKDGEEKSRWLHIGAIHEHEGREYTLRYIKSVERIRYDGDVWNLSIEGHPSFQTAVGMSHNIEKPVELAARAMNYSSQAGENVLDLFGGSGSTIMACEKLSRHGFSMEIDELYTDVIVRRWQAATGHAATLDGTGKTFDEIAIERGVQVADATGS